MLTAAQNIYIAVKAHLHSTKIHTFCLNKNQMPLIFWHNFNKTHWLSVLF